MSQYRHNMITNRWVILATDREKRPSDFAHHEIPQVPDFDEHCPFCPSHETLTPPETFAIRPAGTAPDSPGWSVRVVPNKYPALSPQLSPAPPNIAPTAPLKYQPGAGQHEVIIESPHHNRWLGHHLPDQAILICQALRDRYRSHSQNPDNKLITIFYNHGRTAGASLAHPHFQLLTQSIVPPRITNQLDYCRSFYQQQGQSVFETVIATETDAKQRIIAENEHFLALCPFASMTPFEIYILPRVDQPHFGMLDDHTLASFAPILQLVLARLDDGLNFPDYNMVFHTAPLGQTQYPGFSFFVQIYPRLTISGGYELASDVYINTVAPELAAAFYRGENNGR